MTYRAEIDGLRAVAIIPVVLFHAGFPFALGGFVGVDVFLVISGFLITTVIRSALDAGDFSLADFYERRVRRIFPALLFVVTITTLISIIVMSLSELQYYARTVLWATLMVSNIFFWRTFDYAARDIGENALIHTWSLSLEEQFYVLFPLLMYSLSRARLRMLAVVAIAAASLSIAEAGALMHAGIDGSFRYFMLQSRAWELMIGALAALAQARLTPARREMREAGAALGLGAILGSYVLISPDTPFPGVYGLPATVGAAAIILCATPDTRVGRLLALPALVGIGLVSYSLFLWHQPVFALARISSAEPLGVAAMLILIAVSFVLAWLTWRYVETPFRDPRRIGRTRVFVGAAAGAASLCVIALAAPLVGP